MGPGVSFDDGRVVVYLADSPFGSDMLPAALADDEYFSCLMASSDIFVHDVYISFSWVSIVVGVLAVFALVVLAYVGMPLIRGRRAD